MKLHRDVVVSSVAVWLSPLWQSDNVFVMAADTELAYGYEVLSSPTTGTQESGLDVQEYQAQGPSCEPKTRDTSQCIDKGADCFKVYTKDEPNEFSDCCDGLACGFSLEQAGVWWPNAKCYKVDGSEKVDGKSYPKADGLFADPRGSVKKYLPTGCAPTDPAKICCTERKNLGPELSEGDYVGVYPKVATHNPLLQGRDDGISFFVKGNYVSEVAAEIEGRIVVLGNFIVQKKGVNTIGDCGVGSGIFPNDETIFMEVGGDVVIKSDHNVNGMSTTELGGDIAIGGKLFQEGSGKLEVQADMGRKIIEQAEINKSKYEAMFKDIKTKSEYWSTLYPNGVVIPPMKSPEKNKMILKAGDDECIQVFHIDRFDYTGVDADFKGFEHTMPLVVKFDVSLKAKTILINVASVPDDKGKRIVPIYNWADFWDGADAQGKQFDSAYTQNILWNFYDADHVILSNTLNGEGGQMPGSMVIPKGNLDFHWPGHNGRVIVGGNVTQNSTGSEFHNYEFDPPCCLPLPDDINCDTTPAPTPAGTPEPTPAGTPKPTPVNDPPTPQPTGDCVQPGTKFEPNCEMIFPLGSDTKENDPMLENAIIFFNLKRVDESFDRDGTSGKDVSLEFSINNFFNNYPADIWVEYLSVVEEEEGEFVKKQICNSTMDEPYCPKDTNERKNKVFKATCVQPYGTPESMWHPFTGINVVYRSPGATKITNQEQDVPCCCRRDSDIDRSEDSGDYDPADWVYVKYSYAIMCGCPGEDARDDLEIDPLADHHFVDRSLSEGEEDEDDGKDDCDEKDANEEAYSP